MAKTRARSFHSWLTSADAPSDAEKSAGEGDFSNGFQVGGPPRNSGVPLEIAQATEGVAVRTLARSTHVPSDGDLKAGANEYLALVEQVSPTQDVLGGGVNGGPRSAINSAVTIANGAMIEIDGPSAQSV